MLGSNIARINSMEELLTVPEREEAERFLSIPLNISVVASAIEMHLVTRIEIRQGVIGK